jgi:pilus assembly protein FimV
MGKENKLNTRLKLLAIAVGLAWGGLAGAATLGNISILSGRGQPLQAEIELALADAAEADGLVVKVFAPEAYWNPGAALSASSLRDVSAHAEKRLNGSYVVKLTSSSPVDTEQLALLAEVDSSAGKTVREYIAQWPHSLAATAPATKGDQAEAAGVLVKSGDNLNKIARANKPVDVSMERMLVALYRANPQAFSGKNMNRLQAGKVLRMPGSDELAAVTQSAARRDIHVQVADRKSVV